MIQDLQDGLRPGSGSEDLSDSEDGQGGTLDVQMIYQDLHDMIGNLFQVSMIIRKYASLSDHKNPVFHSYYPL